MPGNQGEVDRNLKKRIQKNLLKWFNKYSRDLPWRKTKDPYAIWVSEIMLQQTQVDTVIPYYERFLRAFPTVQRLGKADLSKILKLWEGLGYYSRARNLQKAARIVSDRFGGNLPDNIEDLIGLPGIGRSTAGAILSIAYNKEAPILDGNVKRVISRLFAVAGDSKGENTDGVLWSFSESLVPEGYASSFNQALMDLGATICTPRDPQCLQCPLKSVCKGWASGHPERFPSKRLKKPIPKKEAVAALILHKGRLLLRQRAPRGLLGGLWEFPNWEINESRKKEENWIKDQVRKEWGIETEASGYLGLFKHTFSHFKLTLRAYTCRVIGGGGKGRWVSLSKLDRFPMPRLHRKIADRFLVSHGNPKERE